MALKDWKNTANQSNFLRFHNIRNMRYIEITELTESTVQGKWSIELRIDKEDDEAKILKTLGIKKSKSEAVNFAKNYMRTH